MKEIKKVNPALEERKQHKLICVKPRAADNMITEFAIEKKDEDFVKKGKAPSIKELIADFFDYTTAHGLGRLASASRVTGRIFWFLCVAGAVTMFVIQISYLFDKYLNIKPISTTLKISYDQNVPFPAITICNMNMMKKSYLQNISEFKELESDYNDIWSDYNDSDSSWDDDFYEDYYRRRKRRDIPLEEFIDINEEIELEIKEKEDSVRSVYEQNGKKPSHTRQRRSATNDSSSDDDNFYCEDYDDEGNCLYEDEPLDKALEYQEQVQVLIANKTFSTGNESITKGGHQFSELIQRCTWKGYQCKNATKYWSSFWDYKYGNCFVFNNGKNKKGQKRTILHSKKPGSTNGLRLLLRIDQEEYVGLLSQTAGVRIVIKEQGEMAFPAEEGINIAPGFSSYIGIRKKFIKRVDPFKNKSCIASDENHETNLYHKSYGTKYSVQSCMKSCLANHQIKECGCAEVDFPTGKPPCNPKNMELRECLGKANSAFSENEIGCATLCRQPCNQVIFQSSVSMSQWPSSDYEDQLLKEAYDSITDEFLRENFMEVVIFYEELNVEEVIQESYYTVTTLLSDIGGQIGLWIGLSILTVCEIIELLFLIFRALILKFSASNKVKESSPYVQ